MKLDQYFQIMAYGLLPYRPKLEKIDPTIVTAGKHRNIRARKDLEDWLQKVSLPYHSPHKFRHGHAVYSLKNAKDISALKAVSQNLMHANLSITDGVYGILSESDVRGQIAALGHLIISSETSEIDELKSLTKKLLQKLEVFAK